METNKKQTAVEWCNQQLVDKQNGNGDSRSWDEIFAEANEMFREQIELAFHYGDYCIHLPDGSWEQKFSSSQHYYEETYGKDK